MPNIYIGGNGSRILHWLANGEFKPDSDSCGYLKDILLAASGFDPKSLFDLEITPKLNMKLPQDWLMSGRFSSQLNVSLTFWQEKFLRKMKK